MIEGITLLHQGIINNPSRIENTKEELEHVTQSRYGMSETPGHGVIAVGRVAMFKTVDGGEDEVECDESKCHPLNNNLFPVPWEQADQCLGLSQPEEEVGHESNDSELHASHDLCL